MNAFTKFERDTRRPMKVRVRSRAYRIGLAEGFSGVSLIGADRDYKFAKSVDASIQGAWKAVGDALRSAEKSKEHLVGKGARETEPAK